MPSRWRPILSFDRGLCSSAELQDSALEPCAPEVLHQHIDEPPDWYFLAAPAGVPAGSYDVTVKVFCRAGRLDRVDAEDHPSREVSRPTAADASRLQRAPTTARALRLGSVRR